MVADEVHLRNGRTVKAEDCRESDGELICRKAGGLVGFPMDQVDRIERSGSGSSSPMRPFRAGRRDRSSRPPGPPGEAPPPLRISGETASVIPGGPAAWSARIGELEKALNRPGTDDTTVRRELAVLNTLLGNESAGTGDFDAAEASYLRATDHDHTLASPRLNLARIRLQQGRNHEAESMVLEVEASRPDDPAVLALLGEVEYRNGRLEEAIEDWSRSLELKNDPRVADRLDKAMREENAEEGFFRASGTHFTLKYDGDRASDALSGEILDHLESTYDDLTSRFNSYPSSVIIVTLYSKEAFYDVTESPAWVGGLFDGQIRVPIGGLNRLTRVARNVFTHELAHCVVYHKARGNSPKWLQEGIAQWAEGKSAGRQRRVLARQFSGASPSDAAGTFSYPQSLSMLEHFLSTWTFSHLTDVLDALGSGSDFESALRSSVGQSYDEFLDSWLRHLNAPGGSL